MNYVFAGLNSLKSLCHGADKAVYLKCPNFFFIAIGLKILVQFNQLTSALASLIFKFDPETLCRLKKKHFTNTRKV